jgi:glycosyltransferase involved in cell wall biosynthesis
MNEVTEPKLRIIACCGGMVVVFGLERMTFEVLRVLRERGAAVHCIVNTWENHRIVALAEQIGASWSTGFYWYQFNRHTWNPIKLAQFVWDILMTSLGLLQDAWHFQPTHILVPEFVTALRNAPALALLRLLGARVILRLGNAPDPSPFYRRLWRWGVNPVIDRFVCNSTFTRHELLAHRIPARKVVHVYNTVPSRVTPSTKGVARDPGKVIYIGQIIPEKGLHLLLEAMGVLLAHRYDARLDVVGPMAGWVAPTYVGYRERLLARASEPDLAERVRFLGGREDIPELLAGASVHCCPSLPEIREGFGLVNIEAKQAGIPSVVLPTGALPELITHTEDGWICSEVSAAALAEGIEYFLADSARLDRASRAAQASAKRFSRELFADAWWKVFHEDWSSEAGHSVPLAR